MRAALGLARRGLGQVWPNPAVGCVLVRYDVDANAAGRVVGRGWTQPGGRPHAETQALDRAGTAARGATAYVTLEPCNHHGETPPCTEALIGAGVSRVVSAIEDPDPRVAGQGLTRLRKSGIEVTIGVCAEEALDLNAGYLMLQKTSRPLVTFKTATTLDGRIATRLGESRWITGEEAREHAHFMRATQDAVMVGVGTLVADDPQLTCRLGGLEGRSPVRVIVDSRMRSPLTSKCAETARDHATWMIVSADGDSTRAKAFGGLGMEILEVPVGEDNHPNLVDTVELLGARGITRLMVEGGGRLAGALFRANLIDRVLWYRASSIMGDDGISAVSTYGVDTLALIRRFKRGAVRSLGEDLLETYCRDD
jgi:diaminohydroxyphosphoribosylaminopyrimidine deaminase/5-amino-6-(5-phosphoribosylamino)uracil reductase